MEDIIGNMDPASRLERARLYVDGDKEIAMKMIEGKYKDIIVLKAGFMAEDINVKGFICIFINYEKHTLNNYFAVATRGGNLSVDTTHQPWQEYLFNIFKLMYSGENDVSATGKLKSELEREFTPALITVLNEKLLTNDTASINMQFEKIISFVLKSNNLKLNIVTEKTSSLHVDEAIENIKQGIEESTAAEKVQPAPAEDTPVKPNIIAQKDQELYDQGHRIIDCKLVLSPVRGKFVSQLEPGDIVKIRVKGETSQDLRIAEKLGWLQDGKMKSGQAKIRSKTKIDKGNLIYAQIATNLFGKIIEEEEVRVYVLNAEEPSTTQKGGLGKTLFIWFLVIVVIVGIIGVMLMINK